MEINCREIFLYILSCQEKLLVQKVLFNNHEKVKMKKSLYELHVTKMKKKKEVNAQTSHERSILLIFDTKMKKTETSETNTNQDVF